MAKAQQRLHSRKKLLQELETVRVAGQEKRQRVRLKAVIAAQVHQTDPTHRRRQPPEAVEGMSLHLQAQRHTPPPLCLQERSQGHGQGKERKWEMKAYPASQQQGRVVEQG